MMGIQDETKRKRTRINFTARQLEALETVFSQTQYPDVTVLETLAERMELPIEKICTWFQNRRSKFRKESKKGHIQWMRTQLFKGKSGKTGSSPSAEPSCHVLTPPPKTEAQSHVVNTNMYKMPTSRVHHRPAPYTKPMSVSMATSGYSQIPTYTMAGMQPQTTGLPDTPEMPAGMGTQYAGSCLTWGMDSGLTQAPANVTFAPNGAYTTTSPPAGTTNTMGYSMYNPSGYSPPYPTPGQYYFHGQTACFYPTEYPQTS